MTSKVQTDIEKLEERDWFDFGKGPELVVAITRFDNDTAWVLTQDGEYTIPTAPR
ncbi:hypothetical protein [Pseudobacteriovorax antillogorgiicola]|uniref:Uncharacterized protein n=1 Tax=Pseudobacteriovorax antillogorgiicola TaxID=1513793 RepID=A0A1Y6B7U7_9BACT|nr:hypothetical protein [Pseudobacteriovorax antillogorgiicola]TCS58564.1 hypothetical protein EDD56_10277 [Pseudobacteriovorax antillogorgiicola]SME97555.1 hypothetical protein SAMN06296036_102366 [Pseudobacteriovorax antillogorgiicola]